MFLSIFGRKSQPAQLAAQPPFNLNFPAMLETPGAGGYTPDSAYWRRPNIAPPRLSRRRARSRARVVTVPVQRRCWLLRPRGPLYIHNEWSPLCTAEPETDDPIIYLE